MRVVRSSLTRSILGLCVVPLIVLLLFVGVIAGLQHATEVADELTQHSDDVLSLSRKLENDLADAGSVGRRYILFGTPSLYKQYFEAVGLVPKDGQLLVEAVRDNPAQHERAQTLLRLANAEVRQANAVMRRMHSGNRAAVVAAQLRQQFRHPRADNSDDVFRRALLALQTTELQLRATRRIALERMWRTWDFALIVCGVVVTAVTILLALTFGRRIIERLRALAGQAGEFARRGVVLEPLAGNDEISAVSRALQNMALQVKERSALLERYRILAENASDAMIFERRSDRRILEANAATVRMFGYSVEELRTMTDRDLRVEREADAPYAQFPETGEFELTYQSEDRRKDGSSFPVEVSMQSATIEGEQVVLKVVRDLSERRATERTIKEALDQAVEASRLKSEFVATMSHEIRTPMNGVIGATELLLDTPLDPHQREYAMTARESAHSLLGVINNILDFSKIEAGKVDVDLVDFDPVVCVEGVGGMLGVQAHAKGISLMTYVDPAIPMRVVGDPTHLRQALVNLVGNAIKFTERGGVSLMAELQSQTADRLRISFTVRDTGIGIDPSIVPRLFSAFTQADGSTTRKYGGTGLGLAITKRLVELMGGEIVVESFVGSGSTFSFELEFRMVEADEPHERENVRGLRALIIDDEEISRDILGRYLASWGLTVAAAASGGYGLQLMREAAERGAPFDVAVVDFRMPELSGLDLGRTILGDPALRGTKLVLVTAFDAFDVGKEAIAVGFSAYLTKPVRQSYLYDAIVEAHVGPVMTRSGSLPEANGAATHPARDAVLLLVEDNEVNRRIALRQLEKLGYRTEVAANGSEAYERTEREHFDAILMDCQMPVMDGFEATRAMRKREGRTGMHVPIIAMTANALASDRDECLAAGMDDYISKPISMHELEAALERWLNVDRKPPAIDADRLAAIFDGDRAEIAAFLQELVPGTATICARIEGAADAAAMRALAHELKGVAGNAGATELAQAARDLEALLKSEDAGDRTLLDVALHRVMQAHARLAAAVETGVSVV